MAASSEVRHLVAIVGGKWIRVERAASGECRLPALPETDTWADLADLIALADDPAARIAAPVNRLGERPSRMLHLLVVDDPSPGHDWLRLADLDQLSEPADVKTAIRSDLQHFRCRQLPEG
jgi:hypothetical protein